MNESKAKGIFDEAKGKLKQAVGDTFGDQKMANSGAVDEVKGHAEQTLGSIKDAAHDATHSSTVHRAETDAHADAANTGHNVRESITNAAEHAKDSISHGIDHLKQKIND